MKKSVLNLLTRVSLFNGAPSGPGLWAPEIQMGSPQFLNAPLFDKRSTEELVSRNLVRQTPSRNGGTDVNLEELFESAITGSAVFPMGDFRIQHMVDDFGDGEITHGWAFTGDIFYEIQVDLAQIRDALGEERALELVSSLVHVTPISTTPSTEVWASTTDQFLHRVKVNAEGALEVVGHDDSRDFHEEPDPKLETVSWGTAPNRLKEWLVQGEAMN